MTYIHPESREIKQYIETLQLKERNLEAVVQRLFQWFDENILYTRLSAPYAPLQRCDLDVLAMKSGTCGDYANLLVSVLLTLGYEVKYVYLKIDCYGNPQDHICAAVWDERRWKLIDATLPYRKWHGYDCPHREYDLLSPEEFEVKMKEEETFWTGRALEWGNEKYAGLFYAPWIHEEVVVNTADALETVFFLLSFDDEKKYQIFVNYFVYLEVTAKTPIMCRIHGEKEYYSFSVKEATHLWDAAQWSTEYRKEDMLSIFQTEQFEKMVACIKKNVPIIKDVVRQIETEIG